MGLGTLREKQLVKTAGRNFRLDTLLPNGQWCMTDLDTGLVDQKSASSLWAAYESGELVFVGDRANAVNSKLQAIIQGLSEAALIGPATPVQKDADGTIGAKRAYYVLATRGKAKPECIKAILTAWNELKWPTLPPGYSTVMRWRFKANGHPNPTLALRGRNERKGRRGHRYQPEVLEILREVRDTNYLCANPRIGIAKAVGIASDRIRLVNAANPASERLPIPKRKAMRAIIAEIDAEEVLAARYGADKAMAMLRVSLGGVKTTRPLERVEIDHTVLSIILLDDDDFTPIGRAFITTSKDAFTRSVLGFYWGAENPSVVSLARCIKHSVQPKIEFLQLYPGVKNDWPCFGAAESWVVDNGLEEHASAVQQAAAEGGVQKVEFCGRVSPWQKPNIERFFRTQDQDLIHGLPGTTMENIAKRTDFDPKKDMLIRWSTFGKILVKWIVDVYMQKPQRILKNRSPYQVWNEHKGSFTQWVPDTTTILECLFLRQVYDRTLDHQGIEYDCLIYNSLDMRVIRSKLGQKLKINIRANDDDLSYIYVQVPGHDVWVRVPCLDQEYAAGLTRWQHTKCKKMQRACVDEGVEMSLAEARQQIRDDIAEELAAVTQGRKKAWARMNERHDRPSVPSEGKSEQLEHPTLDEGSVDSRADNESDEIQVLDVEYFEKVSQ